MLWTAKTYDLEDLYILASIKITDKTFGELSIQIDSFEHIPKSLQLRELQWRVSTKTVEQTVAKGIKKLPEVKEIAKCSRIKYDINLS